MSAGRTQPLVYGGRGNLTPQGVARLNAALRRQTVFGGNATSPMTSGPGGTVMQRRSRTMYRERGYPYGSTRFLWGVDVTNVIVADVSYPAVKVGVGMIALISANTSAVQTATFFTSAEYTLQIDMALDVQYLRLTFSQNAATPIVIDGPFATPSCGFEYAPVFGASATMPLYRLVTPGTATSRVIEDVIPCREGVIELHLPILPLGSAGGDVPTWSGTLDKYLPA